MAFTDTQKDKIRTYLSYPKGFRDQSTRLESMMDVVGASAVEQTAVEAILDELATIDSAIATVGVQAYSFGGLKRADDIEFYEATGSVSTDSPTAVKRGRMLVRRLGVAFGVKPRADYFSTGPGIGFTVSLG